MSLSSNKISEKGLIELLSRASSNTKVADLLVQAGFSTQISHMKIRLDHSSLDFSGCHFNDVIISGDIQKSHFEGTKFENTTFKDINLGSSIFKDVSFTHSVFVNANLNNASFLQSEFKTTKVWNSDFSNASFVDSSMNHSLFAKAKFDNVLDYHNKVNDLHIIFNQPYQNDYSFEKAQFHQIKPIVAIIGDPQWHSGPEYVLDAYGAIPVTINNIAPPSFNDLQLQTEIKNEIQNINANGLQATSIAQQVLASSQPMIKAIKEYSFKVMEQADALWIPGGPDLHPEFYGEENAKSYPSWEYYREVLEFSLAEAALAAGKPIIGICHGSQLMNVYLGGTLHQHVEGHMGVTPLLDVHTQKGLIGSIIDGPMHGPSYHHQAVKDLAPTLEVVASYDGVVKATQSNDGSKVMLCQFHPENQYDQSSRNILKQFINLSSEQQLMHETIKLSDVLDSNQMFDDVNSLVSLQTNMSAPSVETTLHVIERVPSFILPEIHEIPSVVV